MTLNHEKRNGCGACRACCVVMPITDESGWSKPAAVPCNHVCPSQQGCCGIYQDRPKVCREWECGWLEDPWLNSKPDYRPDRLGVMFATDGEGALAMWETRPGGFEDPRLPYILQKFFFNRWGRPDLIKRYPWGALRSDPAALGPEGVREAVRRCTLPMAADPGCGWAQTGPGELTVVRKEAQRVAS